MLFSFDFHWKRLLSKIFRHCISKNAQTSNWRDKISKSYFSLVYAFHISLCHTHFLFNCFKKQKINSFTLVSMPFIFPCTFCSNVWTLQIRTLRRLKKKNNDEAKKKEKKRKEKKRKRALYTARYQLCICVLRIMIWK